MLAKFCIYEGLCCVTYNTYSAYVCLPNFPCIIVFKVLVGDIVSSLNRCGASFSFVNHELIWAVYDNSKAENFMFRLLPH